MVNFAFEETGYAAKATTELYDFVWPMAVGLWNLRWQVKGFLDSVPDPTTEQAYSRFVLGSGIHGTDLKAMLRTKSWEHQQEKIGEIILTNAFAIYENWARAIVQKCPVSNSSEKVLAFPGRLQAYIAGAVATPSAIMATAFTPTLQRHKKYFPTHLNAMLLCYRYFKEIRNVQMHGGGVADQTAVTAYSDYLPVSSAAAMNTTEMIEHHPVIIGKPVKLNMRGVVGFSEILLRLMITIDAELSRSQFAEQVALARLRSSPKNITLGKKRDDNIRKVKGVCQSARLPIPADVPALEAFLLTHRIIRR